MLAADTQITPARNRTDRPSNPQTNRATVLGTTSGPMANLDTLLDDLVASNRILAGLNVLDGFGHVSARHPGQSDRYLLSRSLAPELVTRDDIMTFDLASTAQNNDARQPYLERFIHGEIYAKRPDVQAIVHSHSPTVVPFAASSERLRPIYHMSGFLGDGATVFEMRQRFGMTNLLVRSRDHGADLAKTLGNDNVVLMRGHGFCAVGDTLQVAVYRAYYTQMNAALQQQAIALGGSVKYLADEEARLADETNRKVINRPWELWKRKFCP
jgi:ribulose-5-phosphate 4-epimerase/fuculose-1-phosphate aldolase